MTTTELRRDAGAGAVAGVAGGVVFGAAMGLVGTLPSVAEIVRSDSPVVGFAVHMLIAALIGAGFGVVVAGQQIRTSETVLWGLLYGAFWWFLGAQTLLPVLSGHPVGWTLADARDRFPSLVGHLFYGGVAAVVFVALRTTGGSAGSDAGRPARAERGVDASWRDRSPRRPRIGPLVRGLSAGLLAAGLLYLVIDAQAVGGPGRLALVGIVAGVGYAVLFGTVEEPAGPALVRGTAYGFVIWVLAELTVTPLLDGGRPDWSSASAAGAVERLPPSLLLGAATAVLFGRLGALGRGLFVDDIRMVHREPPGGWGLRALAHGSVAGVAGGVVFTLVLVAVNALPTVAAVMGARAPAAGVAVNLVVALLIGVTYAVLFRGSSFDLVSGVGWGVCYGFFWWLLGTLTLLPALTGAAPQWDRAAIAVAFPALVGQIAYGAALGAVHHLLEVRANPWWVTRNHAEAERVRARRDQSLGSAPALWGLVVLIALTVPLLVSG